MKDKDNIANLFKEKLSVHTEKVDPSVWKAVQSNIGASGAGGFSLLTKLIIGITTVTTIGIATAVFINTSDKPKEEQKISEIAAKKEEKTKEITPKKEVIKKKEISTPPKEESSKVIVEKERSNKIKQEEKIYSKEEEKLSVDTLSKFELQKKETEPPKEIEEEIELFDYVPLKLFVNIDYQKNQFVKLQAEANEADYIYWELGNGDTTSGSVVEYVYEKPGIYDVRVVASNENEVKVAFITVTIEQAGKITKTPNTFSPNNDGKNDFFSIQNEGLSEFQITILNMKQEVVFETDNTDFKWDGINYRTNQKVPQGNYFYIIVAKDVDGNTLTRYKDLTIYY